MDHLNIQPDIKISVKHSNVPLMIESYRLLAEKVEYPLHLGVTEAGPLPGGLIKSIFEFLINSESYKTLEKVAVTDVEYGDIKISDIDTYKELMYTGLEKNSTGLVEEAIQLIPSLPYAYMAMATLMDNDVDKYNYYDIAYTRAMNEIKKVSSITEFSLIFNLLEQKIKYNKRREKTISNIWYI